ncbi:hypothetical protein J4E91_009474 [Alternaria rosae]|nr:hypothetical protein J4E91_009474 [Alternaria rosae]
MSKTKILIVGCGAVGLTQGHILSSGADITYLVRPGRTSAFKGPKKLYDYKENILRTFEHYRIIESPNEVADEEFFCVLDTLDGHTARSESGQATIKAVGDLIRDHPSTFVLFGAMGIDMVDYYASTMKISKERLNFCGSILAHQPTKSIPIPASADASLIAQADILFSYNTGNYGMTLINTNPKLVKAFSDVYNKHPKLRVRVMPAFLESSGLIMVVMVQLMAESIDGWRTLPRLRENTEVWNLMLRTQAEMFSLPRYGWTGRLMAMLFGSWVTARFMEMPVKDALPLQWHEFNAFHHGSKIVKQNLMLLEELIAEGEKEEHKMVALRELVKRAREKAKDVNNVS